MASRGWGQSKNCALLNEKAGNTMTKILVNKDTLYGARVRLPKKKNIVQLPEESVHFPPSEALVTIPLRWVSLRVACQPQAAIITMASLPAVWHEWESLFEKVRANELQVVQLEAGKLQLERSLRCKRITQRRCCSCRIMRRKCCSCRMTFLLPCSQ